MGIWEKAVDLMEKWGLVAGWEPETDDLFNYGVAIDTVARQTGHHPAFVAAVQKQLEPWKGPQAQDPSFLKEQVERRAAGLSAQQISEMTQAHLTAHEPLRPSPPRVG